MNDFCQGIATYLDCLWRNSKIYKYLFLPNQLLSGSLRRFVRWFAPLPPCFISRQRWLRQSVRGNKSYLFHLPLFPGSRTPHTYRDTNRQAGRPCGVARAGRSDHHGVCSSLIFRAQLLLLILPPDRVQHRRHTNNMHILAGTGDITSNKGATVHRTLSETKLKMLHHLITIPF